MEAKGGASAEMQAQTGSLEAKLKERQRVAAQLEALGYTPKTGLRQGVAGVTTLRNQWEAALGPWLR